MELDRLSAYAEPVALIVLLIVAGSLVQGMRRGASGSAKRLFHFIWEGMWTVVSLAAAFKAASWLSPAAESWLKESGIRVPDGELSGWQEAWFTFVTGFRDFSLLRFAVLFLLAYLICRSLARLLGVFLLPQLLGSFESRDERRGRPGAGRIAASRMAGALFGTVLGAGRGMLLLIALFVYVSLLPSAPLAESIGSSTVYRATANGLFEPVAGRVIAKQGPVLTQAVESEFKRILQRKYEIIDRDVPADIEQAAVRLTADKAGDRERAEALYEWIGSRIAYDWDKANDYTERGVWKEQTPEETFNTRKGVCIDVARLYAMMARTAGLEVRVVTRKGADGRGGYGPHAWNEVWIADSERWVPLDATWASSGDWFDPPAFEETHIREV